MVPPREELLPYVNKRKEAAIKYGVTERTVVNWLKKHDLYNPKPNYGCGKLNMEKAVEIRRLHASGKSVKELAAMYSVTFSTISRVVHNLAYRQVKEVADVSVVYNPTASVVFPACYGAGGIPSDGSE